jgi:amino acid adenylation domain-containing protein
MQQTPALKSQEHIWLLNNFIPDNQAFNVYNCFLISGELNMEFLKISLKAVTDQFSSLRRYFDYQTGKVTSFIKPVSEYVLPFNIIETGHNYIENEQCDELTSEINRSFDLSVSPLFRVSLFIFKEEKRILTFVYHKIIIDASSAGFISKLVGDCYSQLCNNNNIDNVLISDNFPEFVTKANKWIESEEHSALLKHWSSNFPDTNEKVELPSDFRNLAEINLTGIREKFEIDNNIFLNASAYSQQILPDTVFLYIAAFGILLHRLSNQDSIIFGFPFSFPDDNLSMIGNLENMLPIRLDFTNSPNLMDIIKQLQENIAFKKNYQKVSYATIINDSKSKKELSLNPFFQTSLSFALIDTPEFDGLQASEIFKSRNGSRLDLSFDLVQNGADFVLNVEYNNSRFSKTTISRWVTIYQLILKGIICYPLLPTDELDILPSTDIQQLIKWNDTFKPFEEHICIHAKLEEQAKQKPNSIALRWDDKILTFGELNKQANQLAHLILSSENASCQIVAVCMDRSPELIISIYAILKAGAAYMPIDTAAPAERTKAILDDAKPIIVLTKSNSRRIIPDGNFKIIELNNLIEQPLSTENSNPALNIPSDSLAYIIYTSGSTGNPKGVMIQHYSVVNMIEWMQDKYPMNSCSIIMLKTPFTFDISVVELFWWSFTGSSLVLLSPGAEKEPSLLIEAIDKFKVTTIQFVPSMFSAFMVYLEAFKAQSKIKSLETMFFIGEALLAEKVNFFYSIMDKVSVPKLVNLYGPTETTVEVSYFDCLPNSENEHIYIGKPIYNTKLLVLNRKNKIQPLGVLGELVIAGTNLARGYLNRPELTSEKFIDITGLNNTSSLKVYKTGDIAKWADIGEIDFFGRIDNQVKIRGFRIELGEIEAKIMEFRGVESCAVIVNKSNQDNPLLIAYLKYVSSDKLDITSLKTFLAERVPAYMIPIYIYCLDEMPLNSSGKINRKALPELQLSETVNKRHSVGKVESIILSIWQDVLKNEDIDTTSNFFDIGGNSIMIPFIAAKLQKEYDLEVSSIDIFQYPTVESLSAFIGSKTDVSSKTLNQVNVKHEGKGYFPEKYDNRIAIVGIAGKFPDADNKEEFWKKLCDGKECLRFFSDEVLEKNDSGYEKNKDNPDYIKSRGILNNIDLWDANFFGYSPHDARYTDPQQRLWFETVWNALEDAGCDPFTYKGAISVHAGVNLNSYLLDNILRNRKLYEDYMHFGDAESAHIYYLNDPAFIATKTAYLFNLRGPAVNVQSACSTALLSVTEACNSLIYGESDMAVAGASSIQTPQEIGYLFQAGGMRASDGHCRPFDKNASGTVFSNAVAAVVLKRLDDAIRDNDEIYGVIRGWAVNNDGNDKIGYAAPSINGQRDLLRKAFLKANVHPEEICYVEAHGTGTILGDPIEVSALSQAFNEKTLKRQYCGLGSVKGNIGHCDEAAGIMGFIKVALAAYNKKIPASINFSEPNPNIDLKNSPFFITEKPIEWDLKKPMIMGVSSFGVGGTNVHVIVEDFRSKAIQNSSEVQKPQIITISAKSKWSLEHNIENIVDFYNNNDSKNSISDISYSTQLRRSHHWINKAFAIVSKDRKPSKTDFTSGSHSKKTKKTVFLFPGQGAQFINMGLALYNSEPLFKEISDAGFAIFKKETNTDLKTVIFNDHANDEVLLNSTEYTQPALFIINYAVAKLYEQFGIIQDESIGHSIGEYVSACISDVFDFETALKIVIKRGQLMQSVPRGCMMAVRTNFEKLNEIKNSIFEIGAINAPQSCTISFKADMLEVVEKVLKDNSIEYVLLKTSHAFHSYQFDVILEEFEKFVNQYPLGTPRRPFISCPTGDYADRDEVTKGSYWAKQLRATVQFDKGITTLQNSGECLFIESGPNTHLSGLTRQNLNSTKKTKIISTIGRETNGNTYEAFLESIGQIWMAGLTIDFTQFYRGESPKLVNIPNYAFEKKRYWIDIDHSKLSELSDRGTALLQEIDVASDYADTGAEIEIRSDANLTDTEKALLEIWIRSIGTSEIEINDSFFDLGGHSLMAVQILSKIKEILHVNVSLAKFMDNPTIGDLSRIIESEKKETETKEDKSYTIDLSRIPLSASQKRIWILSNVSKGNPSYNVPIAYRLKGTIDIDTFKRSIVAVMNRHTITFASFYSDKREPFFRIEPKEVIVQEVDFSSMTDKSGIYEINNFITTQGRKPFNVNKDLLFRFFLLKNSKEDYVFLSVFHHLIFDGWSWWIFINDLNRVYHSLILLEPVNLPPVKKQYFNYAIENAQNYSAENEVKLLNFWKTKLDGIPSHLNFPFDHVRSKGSSGYGGKVFFQLSKGNTLALRRICKEHNSTPFMTLLSAYSILMNKYSGDHDICIGTYINDRPGTAYNNTFGMFVSTLVMRILIDQEETFTGLLNEVRQIFLDSMDHQSIGFEKIVEAVNPIRIPNVNPVFQIVFAWHNDTFVPITQDGFSSEKISIEEGISPFDITFNIWDNDNLLEGDIEFNSDILERETVVRLKDNFLKLIDEIVKKPDLTISALSIVSVIEKLELEAFNNTDVELEPFLLHELFEQKVSEFPDKIAAICENKSITYEELNIRSNQLANYLNAKSINEGDFVGICVNRSIEMLVAVLGVLKSGACYLPIDPDFPYERIEYMLLNTNARELITENSIGPKFEKIEVSKTYIDSGSYNISGFPSTRTKTCSDNKTLAYIIYTSGSTGNPKGVKIHHEAVVNFIKSMAKKPGLTSNDKLLAVTTFSFDISVLELFLPLSVGATVVMASSKEQSSGNALANLIRKEVITIFQATPATWNVLLKSEWKGNRKLKALCGGEALSNKLVKELLPLVNSLWNMYGPTETTVWSTCYQIVDPDSKILVGKPIDNTQIYIIDKQNNEKPVGSIGEVGIGGKGVAKGYHLLENLTNEKFINHNGKGIIYKTGDLGRILSDGNVELFGRIDDQIKMRGYRIEPGEIENSLCQISGIKEAVVKVIRYHESDERLVAFINIIEDFQLTNDEILVLLRAKLPAFMMPTTLKRIKQFPRTPNGKIDKKALLIDRTEFTSGKSSIKPESDIEKLIYKIWSNELKLETFSIHDNFFSIGGNSILLVQVASMLSSSINREIDVINLFEYTTVRTLAEFLTSGANKTNMHENMVDNRMQKKRDGMGSQREKRRR